MHKNNMLAVMRAFEEAGLTDPIPYRMTTAKQ